MSTTKKKRHPLRKLFLLGSLVGIGVAVKNAIADKGGSYEVPAAPPTPAPASPEAATAAPAAEPDASPAPSDSRVQTAGEVLGDRAAENLEDFADPKDAAAKSVKTEGEQPPEIIGKIDPFGIR